MTTTDNPRTADEFQALPYGTVCVDDDGAVWMRAKRDSHDQYEWQPHNEEDYFDCSSADMAEAAEASGTRVVFRPADKEEG